MSRGIACANEIRNGFDYTVYKEKVTFSLYAVYSTSNLIRSASVTSFKTGAFKIETTPNDDIPHFLQTRTNQHGTNKTLFRTQSSLTVCLADANCTRETFGKVTAYYVRKLMKKISEHKIILNADCKQRKCLDTISFAPELVE